MLDIQKEIEFWTEIMRDHSKFQHDSLSPKEIDTIQTTNYFMNLFDTLHQEVLNISELTKVSLANIISKNKTVLTQFIQFKQMMLTKLMKCEIELGMPPSFLNHMINEAMEYYRVLCIADGSLQFNKILENIRLHKVWLPDASGHASFFVSELDPIESKYIKEGNEFVLRFDNLFKKAFEMYTMFERTGLEDGGLYQFNHEIEMTLSDFISYLEKIENLKKACKIYSTGKMTPLSPNHMIREENYYIYRIQTLE